MTKLDMSKTFKTRYRDITWRNTFFIVN